MKAGFAAIVVAAATSVYGQSTSTVTYEDCETSSLASMVTVTNGVTVTYCPECEMAMSSSVLHTTVYTTTYMSLCPTGTVPATYTVTESCTDATPTWSTGTAHIPPGFTAGVQTCTTGCGSSPTPVTITEPCGCMASEGTMIMSPTAAPTAAAYSSEAGTVAYGTPSAAAAGSSEAASAAAATAALATAGSGSNSTAMGQGALANPAGSASNATAAGVCPGPACQAVASSYPSGVSYGNTSGIMPFTGSAAVQSRATLVSTAAAFFAVFALAVAL